MNLSLLDDILEIDVVRPEAQNIEVGVLITPPTKFSQQQR